MLVVRGVHKSKIKAPRAASSAPAVFLSVSVGLCVVFGCLCCSALYFEKEKRKLIKLNRMGYNSPARKH